MPYLDQETYDQLMSLHEISDRNNRRMALIEESNARLQSQLNDIISRYGAIPNPLISNRAVEELRWVGELRLREVYIEATKNQSNAMWKDLRTHFGIKRITQLCVGQIPEATHFLQRWIPREAVRIWT